jgi:hypothetical protein
MVHLESDAPVMFVALYLPSQRAWILADALEIMARRPLERMLADPNERLFVEAQIPENLRTRQRGSPTDRELSDQFR